MDGAIGTWSVHEVERELFTPHHNDWMLEMEEERWAFEEIFDAPRTRLDLFIFLDVHSLIRHSFPRLIIYLIGKKCRTKVTKLDQKSDQKLCPHKIFRDEIFWRWRKFRPTNNLVPRKISPTFFCPIRYQFTVVRITSRC